MQIKVLQENYHTAPIPTYKSDEFDKMIQETNQILLCTTIDRTHDYYIIRAMELGCSMSLQKNH